MLELKEPTVSHHLAILKQLDLLTLRADGNFRWYRLNDEVLGRISRAVFSRDSIAKLAASTGARVFGAKSPLHVCRWRSFAGNSGQLQEATSNPEVAGRFLRPDLNYTEGQAERHPQAAPSRLRNFAPRNDRMRDAGAGEGDLPPCSGIGVADRCKIAPNRST